jgi:hypothetical protein
MSQHLPFFQDVNAATAVHHTLQGAVIPSSGRGGMRIQYPLPFFLKKSLISYLSYQVSKFVIVSLRPVHPFIS